MMITITEKEFDELRERNRMLSDIALSAICLKMNLENGFPPRLDALNRDLAAFHRRFGDVPQVVEDSADNRAVGASSASVTTKPVRSEHPST